MIESLLRRFCESKHRSLIVIAGTFVVGLVLILPLVDVYSAGLDEQEDLLGQLESARQVAADLNVFERRVSQKLKELEAFDRRTVNDESLPALREKLMELAKETGCSIRRLSVGNPGSRPWSPGENLTGPADPKRSDTKTGYLLEWRPLNISLSGTSTSLQSMMERITSEKMLLHTKSFEMYPSGAKREFKTLDLELWYFTLSRRA